jgi:hypothetical protein
MIKLILGKHCEIVLHWKEHAQQLVIGTMEVGHKGIMGDPSEIVEDVACPRQHGGSVERGAPFL